jgi:hypothetical protein
MLSNLQSPRIDHSYSQRDNTSMISDGQTISTLQLVQIIEGLGSIPIGSSNKEELLDVAQWEPTANYYCEFQHEGTCDGRLVSWGTSDPFEPKFCTAHFFSGDIGYEFVQL